MIRRHRVVLRDDQKSALDHCGGCCWDFQVCSWWLAFDFRTRHQDAHFLAFTDVWTLDGRYTVQ
jgi:hypothetical protein